MKMEAIKKVAAVGVLLCGVSFAGPIQADVDEGKFIFTVDGVTTINCEDAASQDAQTEALTNTQTAENATAEIVCHIETNSEFWGVSMVAQHGGIIVDEYNIPLQIDHLPARLATFSTLETENENVIKIIGRASIDTDPYEDATEITTGVASTIMDDSEFQLEDLFGEVLDIPAAVFVGYGPVKAKLTVKGAPKSQTISNVVTSGNGEYTETLIFTVAGININ